MRATDIDICSHRSPFNEDIGGWDVSRRLFGDDHPETL